MKAFDISVKDSFMKVVIADASMVAGIYKHNVSRNRLINPGEHMGGLRLFKDRQGVSAYAQMHSQMIYDYVVDSNIIYASGMTSKC